MLLTHMKIEFKLKINQLHNIKMSSYHNEIIANSLREDGFYKSNY